MPDGAWDALRQLTRRVQRLELTDARQRLVPGGNVTYDGGGSGLTGDTVQEAIDEVAQDHLDHLNDGADAHDAAAVSFDPAGTSLVATNVQDAIEEVAAAVGSPASDTHVWLPLTTVVAGEPVLVWDADNNLIPTLTPL